MRNLARSLKPAVSPRAVRRVCVLLGAAAALVCVTAAPAGAFLTTAESQPVGVAPRTMDSLFDGALVIEGIPPSGVEAPEEEEPTERFYFNSGAQKFENATGDAVLHGAATYAIYWDPTNHYHGDWQHVIDGYFASLDTPEPGETEARPPNDVFAVATQYTDRSDKPAYNSFPFRGAYTDTHPYPTPKGCTDPHALTENEVSQVKAITCISDAQVRTELTRFVEEQHLPKGMGSVYYVLTPPGVGVCLDHGGPSGSCSDYEEGNETSYEQSFCSYHGAINPDAATSAEAAAMGDASTLVYAVIPWTAGGRADGQLSEADREWGTPCQDAGFNPVSPSPESFAAANPWNDQEPNQVKCPSPDGFCDTGLADLIINQIGIQQQDVVTDPLLNAWHAPNGYEAADECRGFFAPAKGSWSAEDAAEAGSLYNQEMAGGQNYFVNDAFNAAAYKLNYPAVPCLAGVRLEPQFTAPTQVKSGETVMFDGMESDITLNANTTFAGTEAKSNFATYEWVFGDGTAPVTGFAPGAPACETPWLSPCAASVPHIFQYGGTYDVTLKVTDVGGESAEHTVAVTVSGPPQPTPPPVPPPPAENGSTTSSATPAIKPPVPPAPAPVAAAAVLSHSLRSVKQRGVVVRYSVNEQVAGRFEVLLRQSIAKRLHIPGSLAVGLAPGSAPEVVIAKAVLVTTAGGRSTIDIHLPKRIERKLAHLRHVPLMLRLVVHNAGHSPLSTALLTAFTLSR